jgi:penicillin G amidase
MLKWIVRIVAALLILFGIGLFVVWMVLHSSVTDYNGEGTLDGLEQEVDVYFDVHGIPHIEAKSKPDAYRALGYLHASERLFQMEMMRRVGSGRLAEILGPEFTKTDLLFRSIFYPELIRNEVKRFQLADSAMRVECQAYLEGVNAFIKEKPLQPEFLLLGIEPAEFTQEDFFYIAGYMAYSFGLAQRTDPLADDIYRSFGSEYLDDLALNHAESEPFNPTYERAKNLEEGLSSLSARAVDAIPMAKFEGSNSWVVSGRLTASGKPILCNDTHIGYGVPQVWYEAHLVCPGYEFYGNFLPGIPYALVGHNDAMAWGVTMLENDDMDFYLLNSSEEGYQYEEAKIPWNNKEFTIARKGAADTTVVVLYSHHGPVVTDFFPQLQGRDRCSFWWDYTRLPNNLFSAFYALNNTFTLSDAEQAASKIHGPGLNITYADTTGNIAWWACAKLQRRDPGINTKLLLDGSLKSSEPQGYLPFSENPKSVNPPWQFVYSANDQPGPINGEFYPGYYKPHHRADRIKEMILEDDEWTQEKMKAILTDVKSPVDSMVFHELLTLVEDESKLPESTDILNWNGDHRIDDIAPQFYYRWLYHILYLAMADEIGSENFNAFLTTHWMKRGYPMLLMNDNSLWWNNTNSPEFETRRVIVNQALEATLRDSNVGKTAWGEVHQLELQHPFSAAAPWLSRWLNIGPLSSSGGHETICQSSFILDSTGGYTIRVGSQMRIVIDMAQPKNSESISPSGQSGHFLSPYYDDQFEAYVNQEFRKQIQEKYSEKTANHLHLCPSIN